MLKLIEAELNELLNESDDVEKIDYIDLKVCDEKTQFKSYFFFLYQEALIYKLKW